MLKHLLVGLVLLLPMACNEGSRAAMAPGDPKALAQFVTGDAARHLTPDGHFQMPVPTPVWFKEMGQAQADSLAEFEIRRLARYSLRILEGKFGHQGPIDLPALRRCGTTIYAATPYMDPGAAATRAVRMALGSHWIMLFCDRSGTPVVSVAIAALGSDAHVNARGDAVSLGPDDGGVFSAIGLPTGHGYPISAESAAVTVARATQRHVTEVPRFFMPEKFLVPGAGAWAVPIDGAVRLRDKTAAAVESSEQVLYVGRDRTPEGRTVLYRPAPSAAPELVHRTNVPLARRTDAAPQLEEAAVATTTPVRN